MIKSFLKIIFVAMIIFSLFYLMGCFYSTTFNIAKWTEDTRAAVIISGGIFSLVGMIITATFESTKV